MPDLAARFENLVASHRLKSCHHWTDTGEGTFELRFLRNKEKHEIDFLIVRDGEPWLPVEVKLDDTTLSPHFDRFMGQIGCDFGLQLVRKPGVRKTVDRDGVRVLIESAATALRAFV